MRTDGHDSTRLRGAIELEMVVNRGEAPVEGGAELGVVVELPGGSDVQLDAVHQRERRAQFLLHRADARPLLEKGLTADSR
jgi:hypothetical protein